MPVKLHLKVDDISRSTLCIRKYFLEVTCTSSTSLASTPKEEESSLSVTKTRENVRIRKPFKNLVKLFKDISRTNDQAIHDYIQV